MLCMNVDSERFTLDTNLLVYSVDSTAGARHDLAIEIVDRATECDCYLTLQALSEFYAAVTRKGIVRPADAAARAQDWLGAFRFTTASATAVTTALNDAVAGTCVLLGRAPGGDRRRGGVPGHAE
jgi:predicted nucleic acid-binding protein